MTYCFDLDGTLCTGEVYAEARPIEANIAIVNRLYDAGHTIVIDTARGSVARTRLEEYRAVTIRQLAAWGVRYHELRVGQKVAADVYVDDRGRAAADFFSEATDGL